MRDCVPKGPWPHTTVLHPYPQAVPALTRLAQKFSSLLTSWMSSEWQKGRK